MNVYDPFIEAMGKARQQRREITGWRMSSVSLGAVLLALHRDYDCFDARTNTLFGFPIIFDESVRCQLITKEDDKQVAVNSKGQHLSIRDIDPSDEPAPCKFAVMERIEVEFTP